MRWDTSWATVSSLEARLEQVIRAEQNSLARRPWLRCAMLRVNVAIAVQGDSLLRDLLLIGLNELLTPEVAERVIYGEANIQLPALSIEATGIVSGTARPHASA